MPLLISLFLQVFASASAEVPFVQSIHFTKEDTKERKTVFVSRTESPPEIDGKMDDGVWKTSLLSSKFMIGKAGIPRNNTVLFGAFDASHLYVAAKCEVAEMEKLKTSVPSTVDETARVWNDDCVDFKLSADNGRTTAQFIASAVPSLYDAQNSKKEWSSGWQVATSKADTHFVVEMKIPLKALGIAELRPGLELLLSFGRNDVTGERRELSTAFGETYGAIDKGVTLVLGNAADHQTFLASGMFTRDSMIHLYLDRDQYPTFQKIGTGRARVSSNPTGEKVEGDVLMSLLLKKGEQLVGEKRIDPLTARVVDFDWIVRGRPAGTYMLIAELSDDKGKFAEASKEIVLSDRPVVREGRVRLEVYPAPANADRWPVRFGVPFPWGALDSDEHVKVTSEDGEELPVQVQTTGTWSKAGSIRWLLVDTQRPMTKTKQSLWLEYGPNVSRRPTDSPLKIVDDANGVLIDTGVLKFTVPRKNACGLGEVWIDRDHNGTYQDSEQVMTNDATSGPYMVREDGAKFLGSKDAEASVTVEESGPLRATIKIAGWHTSDAGDQMGRFELRLTAFRGLPYIRAYHTFVITDDSDKVRYRDIGWSLPFNTHTYVFGTPSITSGLLRGFGAYLLQKDDLFYKVYEKDVFRNEGHRAEGWMTCGSAGKFMTVAVKDFWQQFPKELEVAQRSATVHFWPGHGEAPTRTGDNLSIHNVYQQWFAHEGEVLNFKVPEEVLQHVKTDSEKYNWPSAKVANAMGLAKSHEVLLYFHPESWEQAESREVNRIFQSAPTVVVDPEWVCRSKVFGELHPREPAVFPKVERTIDETVTNIARHREMDRDYGMFNYGDSHHNWDWMNRRWNLHRIWRNTHHGWTRWPWLMYARSGNKKLLDWADSNARHVADVDHCHYTTEEFFSYNYPREKKVGGICDYKGFVHWASGGRRGYNSAADAMLWHYYFTGNERSLITAFEHGELLLWDGKPLPHREGSGRSTSAAALYFKTWDNDYLEFLEKTIERLLSTQTEDGRFPQWENFAPFLQRYVDLTQSRRGMKAMIRWADWICAQPNPPTGYHAKTNILAHAYLYTRDEKYLSYATYAVADFTDYLYQGSDPRYQGMSIPNHTNLHQSYFMQEAPYYLAAVSALGKKVEPPQLTRTSIRCLSREKINGKDTYVFHARFKQMKDEPFTLNVPIRGYAKMSYTAVLTPLGKGQPVEVTQATKPLAESVSIPLHVPADGADEYALRILADKNFFVSMPMTAEQPGLKEVYPIFREGITVGNGYRYFFNVPDGAMSVTMKYQGRAWPLQFNVFDPDGNVVATDTWIGSNELYLGFRTLSADIGTKPRQGWSFAIVGYGQARLDDVRFSPPVKQSFYFSAQKTKLFVPTASHR